MKKIIFVSAAITLALLMSTTTATAQKFKGRTDKNAFTKTVASDNRITFIGRTQVIGNDVSFDWTGTYARVKFNGLFLSVRVSDTKKDYYNVWLDSSTDKTPDKVISIAGNDTTIVLFGGSDFAAKGTLNPHEVIIQKRTEGEQGTTTFHEFITKGAVLQADPLKGRQIEFIGDSYTCGYGTEAQMGEHFKPETENVNYSYAPIVSRYFNADYTIIAHSGIGITRNYNDNGKGYYMPDRYLQTFDVHNKDKWKADSSTFKPAITVILLGTNDFSTGRQPIEKYFIKNYTRLLNEIKANYGADHTILCTAAKGDANLFEYVRAAAEQCGLKNVQYMGYGLAVFAEDEYGADGHPNYKAHRKIAHSVIPYISTLTGWELAPDGVR